MHAKSRVDKPGGGNEGTTIMLKACWLVYQYSCLFLAFFPLFSIGVRLLILSLHLRPSLFTGFSSFVLPCSADLVCKKWSKDRKAVPACFGSR